MSLKFKKVLITPEIETALSNAVDADKHPEAYKFIAYVRDELYSAWQELPEGSHLKAAYLDEVWTWNDSDLVNPNEI